MTSDNKRKEVMAYLEKVKEAAQHIMSLSNCDKYLKEEIVAVTIEQLVANEWMKKAAEQFEKVKPPVVDVESKAVIKEITPTNVVPFRRNS